MFRGPIQNNPPLVLFDLDETLIDRQYQPNIAEQDLIAAFRTAIDKGFVLGLNSDSPHVSLQEKYGRWGMNGPVVSERGAAIVQPGGGVEVFAAGAAAQFPRLRERLVAALQQRPDVTLKFGHVWQLAALSQAIKPDERLVIINPHRQFSLSFWVRCGAGQAAQASLLRQTVAALETLIEREFPDIAQARDTPFDVNDGYGICVAQLRSTTKTAAVSALADRDRRVFMIGNSMSDWIDDARVTHGAVANSDAAFRARTGERAGLLATEPLTRGALQLLARIMESAK